MMVGGVVAFRAEGGERRARSDQKRPSVNIKVGREEGDLAITRGGSTSMVCDVKILTTAHVH